ncbi:hypothetical protein IXO278_20525, partial [Xanthomonas oryzae pv. oryzae]
MVLPLAAATARDDRMAGVAIAGGRLAASLRSVLRETSAIHHLPICRCAGIPAAATGMLHEFVVESKQGPRRRLPHFGAPSHGLVTRECSTTATVDGPFGTAQGHILHGSLCFLPHLDGCSDADQACRLAVCRPAIRPYPPTGTSSADKQPRETRRTVMTDIRYVAPRTLDEAIGAFAAAGSAARIMAGGTDLLVQMRSGLVRPGLIVDIKKICHIFISF